MSARRALLFTLLIAFTWAGCQPQAVPPAQPTAAEAAPTTSPDAPQEPSATPAGEPGPEISVHLGAAPLTLDPARAAPLDASALDLAENLFIGLTSLDPATGSVEPALATRWEVSADGLTWTIFLRDDIYWAFYSTDIESVEQARLVTAADVVAAVVRGCRTETGAPQTATLFTISGCREINRLPAEQFTQEAVDRLLGARVLNDVVLEFTLAERPGVFPAVMSMPILRPVPAERVSEDPEGWPVTESPWASGPYVVQSTAEDSYTLIANPHWPEELQNPGAPARVEVRFGPSRQALADYEAGELALATLSAEQAQTLDADMPHRYLAQPLTAMIAFNLESPILNKPELRRAFSIGLDRQRLIDEVLLPQGVIGIPALTTAPPGTAYAPAYGEIGLRFSAENARSAAAAAGYTDCLGVPDRTFMHDDSALTAALVAGITGSWGANLGCRETLFTTEPVPYYEVLVTLTRPRVGVEQPRPAVGLLYWQGEAPHALHWYADIFGCKAIFVDAYLNQLRHCSDGDNLLRAAAELRSGDPLSQLVGAASGFFSDQGEAPVIPIYHQARLVVLAEGVDIGAQQGGPLRFDRWQVP